jgi:hypothetical protein
MDGALGSINEAEEMLLQRRRNWEEAQKQAWFFRVFPFLLDEIEQQMEMSRQ